MRVFFHIYTSAGSWVYNFDDGLFFCVESKALRFQSTLTLCISFLQRNHRANSWIDLYIVGKNLKWNWNSKWLKLQQKRLKRSTVDTHTHKSKNSHWASWLILTQKQSRFQQNPIFSSSLREFQYPVDSLYSSIQRNNNAKSFWFWSQSNCVSDA